MITRDDIAGIVENYDRMKLRVGMTASPVSYTHLRAHETR